MSNEVLKPRQIKLEVLEGAAICALRITALTGRKTEVTFDDKGKASIGLAGQKLSPIQKNLITAGL